MSADRYSVLVGYPLQDSQQEYPHKKLSNISEEYDIGEEQESSSSDVGNENIYMEEGDTNLAAHKTVTTQTETRSISTQTDGDTNEVHHSESRIESDGEPNKDLNEVSFSSSTASPIISDVSPSPVSAPNTTSHDVSSSSTSCPTLNTTAPTSSAISPPALKTTSDKSPLSNADKSPASHFTLKDLSEQLMDMDIMDVGTESVNDSMVHILLGYIYKFTKFEDSVKKIETDLTKCENSVDSSTSDLRSLKLVIGQMRSDLAQTEAGINRFQEKEIDSLQFNTTSSTSKLTLFKRTRKALTRSLESLYDRLQELFGQLDRKRAEIAVRLEERERKQNEEQTRETHTNFLSNEMQTKASSNRDTSLQTEREQTPKQNEQQKQKQVAFEVSPKRDEMSSQQKGQNEFRNDEEDRLRKLENQQREKLKNQRKDRKFREENQVSRLLRDTYDDSDEDHSDDFVYHPFSIHLGQPRSRHLPNSTTSYREADESAFPLRWSPEYESYSNDARRVYTSDEEERLQNGLESELRTMLRPTSLESNRLQQLREKEFLRRERKEFRRQQEEERQQREEELRQQREEQARREAMYRRQREEYNMREQAQREEYHRRRRPTRQTNWYDMPVDMFLRRPAADYIRSSNLGTRNFFGF